MKLKRFCLLFLSGLTLISLLKILNVNPWYFQYSSVAQTVIKSTKIPETISPCVPRGNSIQETEIDGIVKYEGKTYYLIGIIEKNQTIFENETELVDSGTIILEDEIGCLIKQPKEKFRTHSKTLFVPVPVAQLLALEYLQKYITEIGGEEAFKKAYEEIPTDAADGPWIIYPEDAWAYEQLGLELPNPHVIVNTADDPKAQSPTPGMD